MRRPSRVATTAARACGMFGSSAGRRCAAAAVGFETDMPAGRARMAYWPDDDGGFHWVVESRTRKGWNRFVHHRYRRDATAAVGTHGSQRVSSP